MRNIKIIVSLFLVLLLLVSFFIYKQTQKYSGGKIVKSEIEKENTYCRKSLNAQTKTYNDDVLATKETFSKHETEVYSGILASLDPQKSSKEAQIFESAINSQLASTSINFAGRYSFVRIGMTGWGNNYFFVDRVSGKGINFQYKVRYLDTRKDSTLLIINSKEKLFSDLTGIENICGSTGNADEWYPDLRPYYYIWDGTSFIQLGNEAQKNLFWSKYF